MRLCAKTKHMSKDLQQKVATFAKGFEDQSLKTSLDDAVKLLAHVYIISSLFQGTGSQANEDKKRHVKNASKWLDHIQRVLQYPSSKLNPVLAKHVLPNNGGSGSTGKRAASVSSLNTVATAADFEDPATLTGSSSRHNDAQSGHLPKEPPKKKLKTFKAKDPGPAPENK